MQVNDPQQVNLQEPYEVIYWCEKWGCSGQQLLQAVSAVGTSVEAVARYLGK